MHALSFRERHEGFLACIDNNISKGIKGYTKMTREELEKQPKDILITWLLNSEYHRLTLNKRLEKLTGCAEFGLCDGMTGFCVECSYEQPELWEKCHNFKFDKQ